MVTLTTEQLRLILTSLAFSTANMDKLNEVRDPAQAIPYKEDELHDVAAHLVNSMGQ